MEIWATPTHPPLRTYTNSSLASCILVQLSDLCNLGFAVGLHVQYGITNTYWRHARYWGGVQGCIAPPKFPNLQKKLPQIAVCEQRKSEKLGILCIFGQRNGSKFRVLFCQICTLWGKKKTPEFLQNAHIQKIRKRSTFEKFAPSSDENPWYGLGWSQSNAKA